MFGSTVLEIGIGLSLVFFVLSLVASAMAEAISQAFQWRSKSLEEGIENLLADKAFAEKFYGHSLVKGLYKGDRKPSYVPAELFATVVLDLESSLGEGQFPPQLHDALRVFRKQFPGPVATVEASLERVAHTVKETRDAIEDWFDQAMDRVSGWYKRRLQIALWIIGLGTAAAVNGDTIAIVESLNRDRALREAVVAAAGRQVQAGQTDPSTGQTIGQLMEGAAGDIERIRGLGIPLGWDGLPQDTDVVWWVMKVVGLLLTGASVSLGAPFWFSVLNKLVNMRGGGSTPKRGRESRAAAQG
jgi:hypothetical protein